MGIGSGESGLDGSEIWVDDERAEAGEDPGPRAEDIVGDIEEERTAEGIFFGFGSEHALGDVGSAAGFGTWIPIGPPADGDGEDKNHQGEIGHGEIGEEIEERLAVAIDGGDDGFAFSGGDDLFVGEFFDEGLEAEPSAVLSDEASADFFEGEVGGGENGGHFDKELDHINDEHAPEAGVGGEEDIENAAGDNRLPRGEAEEDIGDFAGGEGDHAHDEAVKEEAEVNGAEATDERGGATGVAVFVEFEIGEDAGASPQAGKEEDRGDAGKDEGPPLPIASDAEFSDLFGDPVWGIGGESGGDHGETGEPPRD